MLRCLGGAVVALAQQPVSGTKRQRGVCKRGDLARARLEVEDHELARQRDQADEDHGLDLDDAVLTRRHAHDGMLELHRDQERHDHAEHALEYLVVQGIEGIEDQQREDDGDKLEQRHHDDDGNYRRQNEGDDLLEALVNRSSTATESASRQGPCGQILYA